MLLPETLFDCLWHQFEGLPSISTYNVFMKRFHTKHQFRKFPSISTHSVFMKRYWTNPSSDVKKEKHSLLMRNWPVATKKRVFDNMSKGMKKYWANLSPRKTRIHMDLMNDGAKKLWSKRKNNPKYVGTRNYTAKIKKIIRDVPRINNYSGVVTESQIDEVKG